MNKRLDASRDIAIKQAELAFQNTQFIIQQGLALESTLINFANAVAQRTFESTKALQDTAIAIFNASLAKYQAQLEAYKTKAAVFETLIRGEIGKAEFYKAQVAAAQVTADVNRAYADLYRIQIQGVEELIKMYATEMEAAKIKSDIDRNRIEVFKAQIEAFAAQVNAKTAELHLHQARIEGEKAKVQVYASQVDAFSKRVEAAKTEGSIKIEEARAKVENNRNLVARYSADIDGYKANLQGLVEKMNAALKVYEASGVVFRAKADSQAAIANVDVKAREAAIQALIAQMNLSLREAEVNIRAHHDAAQLKVAAAEGGARVAAQLAAGIFSGVSVQAHINASAGASKSYSGIRAGERELPAQAGLRRRKWQTQPLMKKSKISSPSMWAGRSSGSEPDKPYYALLPGRDPNDPLDQTMRGAGQADHERFPGEPKTVGESPDSISRAARKGPSPPGTRPVRPAGDIGRFTGSGDHWKAGSRARLSRFSSEKAPPPGAIDTGTLSIGAGIPEPCRTFPVRPSGFPGSGPWRKGSTGSPRLPDRTQRERLTPSLQPAMLSASESPRGAIPEETWATWSSRPTGDRHPGTATTLRPKTWGITNTGGSSTGKTSISGSPKTTCRPFSTTPNPPSWNTSGETRTTP